MIAGLNSPQCIFEDISSNFLAHPGCKNLSRVCVVVLLFIALSFCFSLFYVTGEFTGFYTDDNPTFSTESLMTNSHSKLWSFI